MRTIENYNKHAVFCQNFSQVERVAKSLDIRYGFAKRPYIMLTKPAHAPNATLGEQKDHRIKRAERANIKFGWVVKKTYRLARVKTIQFDVKNKYIYYTYTYPSFLNNENKAL